MKILALGGSIRAIHPGSRDLLLDLVRPLTSLSEYIEAAKQLTASKKRSPLSNTEILCGAALCAAHAHGTEVDYFNLARLFPRRERALHDWQSDTVGVDEELRFLDTLEMNLEDLAILRQKVRESDGILLSSPVYFGDRSSVLDKFIQLARSESWLHGKAVAALSAGAKRNGGQETTNIFALGEALELGAFVVGNGPESCQYGGTAVGGDVGTVLADAWGIKTAFETGHRLAEVLPLTAAPESKKSLPGIKLVILVTMDTAGRRLSSRIREYLGRCPTAGWHAQIIELIDLPIERCLGCDICPIPELRETAQDYACIIQTERDRMNEAREAMLTADGILLAGLSAANTEATLSRYQAFTERTRFIRRNDFELTNVPLAAFLLEDAGAKSQTLFALKVMTSYLRHNTIVCPPVREVWFESTLVKDGYSGFLDFLTRVAEIKSNRTVGAPSLVSYKANGYSDRRLDETEALR